MEDFGFKKMQEIQKELQERYKDRWEPVCAETGKNKLLWLMTELGEVIDIIKKQGDQKIMEEEEVRTHFIEEMADVLMYFNDVMLCYDISVEELKKIYLEKHHRNMDRW
ncbi:MAG: nucleotide pyrophosphohydrolase [Lachnospiraceae bacterium]|nr:nucleotide pyrophosphohydrolase [Lachnospiraceae bacterium]